MEWANYAIKQLLEVDIRMTRIKGRSLGSCRKEAHICSSPCNVPDQGTGMVQDGIWPSVITSIKPAIKLEYYLKGEMFLPLP